MGDKNEGMSAAYRVAAAIFKGQRPSPSMWFHARRAAA